MASPPRRRTARRAEELDDALELLHFALRGVAGEADRTLSAIGLGRVHHRVLYFVRRNPGVSVGQLLAILDVTKQALHKPMQELIEGGYLASERAPSNRRVKVLVLTRAGSALEERLSAPQRELLARALTNVGSGGERAWRTVSWELGAHRAALQGWGIRPVQRA